MCVERLTCKSYMCSIARGLICLASIHLRCLGEGSQQDGREKKVTWWTYLGIPPPGIKDLMAPSGRFWSTRPVITAGPGNLQWASLKKHYIMFCDAVFQMMRERGIWTMQTQMKERTACGIHTGMAIHMKYIYTYTYTCKRVLQYSACNKSLHNNNTFPCKFGAN